MWPGKPRWGRAGRGTEWSGKVTGGGKRGVVKDEEIEALVATVSRSMHGVVDDITMREGDRALVALIGDTLKTLSHIATDLHEIAEATRVLAKAKAFEVASRGGSL